MRILLLSPKGPLYRHRGGIFKKSLRYAPLTLVHLAALVPDELKAQITIVDEGIDEIDTDVDVDLVAMTVITGCANRAYELSALFRERGVPVVLGGPHITLVPDDAAPHADAIVVGYAEQTWPQLLRDFAGGHLQARYDMAADFELRDLPLPRHDLIDPSRYTTINTIEATRACIHNCEFCVVPSAWGRKPLKRPIEEVVEEIRARRMKKMIFLDLNLISDRDYTMALFEALIPLKIRWYGLSTSLLGKDDELLDMLVRSGGRGVLIGLESVSKTSLKETRKGFNQPDDYTGLVQKLHSRGVVLQGTFAFGFDGDTTDSCQAAAQFSVDAGIDLPRFAILTPFPGTPLHARLESEGRILTRNWDLYDGQHVVFEPSGMSTTELDAANHRAWRHAYSAANIARRLGRSRVQLPIAVAANLGYRYYARHLRTHYNCDSPLSFEANAA